MENDDIIENFGALPAEEQARLVARQEDNEWAAIGRTRRENAVLEEKNRRLKALLEEQTEVVSAMERLAEQSRRISAEKESLLAE